MTKKGTLLGVLDKTLQLGGAVFEKCFNLTVDGFQDVMFSAIDYSADLTNINKSKIFDFISMMSMRRTFAASIYPTLELEELIIKHPNCYRFKIDLVEQLERQALFTLKIAEWTALSPIQKKMVNRIYKNITEAREEIGLTITHYNEIRLIMFNVASEIEKALDVGDEENYKNLLIELIRCQVILNESENINDYLDILKIYNLEMYSFLKGKYLLINGFYEESLKYLEVAFKSEIPTSRELIAECIDELIKRDKNSEYYIDLKRSILGGIFVKENSSKIKNLPITFILVKWNEIVKVYKNISNQGLGDKSA